MTSKYAHVLMRVAATVTLLSTCGGCCCWTEPNPSAKGQWYVVTPDDQKRIISEKYDRGRLRSEVGEPTIDDGEEWIYVGKFTDGTTLTFGLVMSFFSPTERPNWKLTVVTFDRAGFVSRIRVASATSAIAEEPTYWALLGISFEKKVRIREAGAWPREPSSRPSVERN